MGTRPVLSHVGITVTVPTVEPPADDDAHGKGAPRRVIVGDVQGCRAALDALLARLRFRRGIDVLHPAGDLVAKGPDSLGVLRRCMELGAEPVLGNHDLAWLDAERIPDAELRDWLAAQPLLRVLPDCGAVIVHAGLDPTWSGAVLDGLAAAGAAFAVGDTLRWYATTVRYCAADGRRPERDWPPPDGFRPWDDWLSGQDGEPATPVVAALAERTGAARPRVLFGHWARRGLDLAGPGWALDSGACYGGRLSAVVLEPGRPDRVRVVQVAGWSG